MLKDTEMKNVLYLRFTVFTRVYGAPRTLHEKRETF